MFFLHIVWEQVAITTHCSVCPALFYIITIQPSGASHYHWRITTVSFMHPFQISSVVSIMSFTAKGFNPRIMYCIEFLCLLQSGVFPKSLLDFCVIDLTIRKLTNESFFFNVFQVWFVRYFLVICCFAQLGFLGLVVQVVKNLPAMQKMWVRSLGQEDPLGRAWQPTEVFLPGEFHGQRNLVGYSPWGLTELDTPEQLPHGWQECDNKMTQPLWLCPSH